jgi:hypothetical protein
VINIACFPTVWPEGEARHALGASELIETRQIGTKVIHPVIIRGIGWIGPLFGVWQRLLWGYFDGFGFGLVIHNIKAHQTIQKVVHGLVRYDNDKKKKEKIKK